jgi:hypothetical protein
MNRNVGPPKFLFDRSQDRLSPAREKSARTPPPTFLFLPIHNFKQQTPAARPPAPPSGKPEGFEASLFQQELDEKPRYGDELRRCAIAPSGGAPWWRYIGSADF